MRLVTALIGAIGRMPDHRLEVLSEPRFRDVCAKLFPFGFTGSTSVVVRQRIVSARTLRMIGDVIRFADGR